MSNKLLVIGLDCATPQLVFKKYLKDLHNIRSLMKTGFYAEMESTIPPITVPAWSSMLTGCSPGELGCYGFRNRKTYDYQDMYFANSLSVKKKTVWNYLSLNRKTSILLGIPQTYPPKPLNGIMVSSFLTPDNNSNYTYPAEFKKELETITNGYIIDVKDFRTENKKALLEQIILMTNKRFKAARYLLNTRRWDFFMMVEMGVDRMHHAFWRFIDPEHRLYKKGNKFENVLLEYYKLIDEKIGLLINDIENDTNVIIVSDHGAKAMKGAICINEWLIQKGYLKLKEYPDKPTKLELDNVDWTKTKAWGYGGYYGRLFINVKEREPEGVIPREEYSNFINELRKKIMTIRDDKGNKLENRVFLPQEIYQEVNNIAPDLIIYFDDLNWRSAGSIGHGKIHLFENDTGPDDANHAQNGIFIMHSSKTHKKGNIGTIKITDIAPTMLDIMDIKKPAEMKGNSFI